MAQEIETRNLAINLLNEIEIDNNVPILKTFDLDIGNGKKMMFEYWDHKIDRSFKNIPQININEFEEYDDYYLE